MTIERAQAAAECPPGNASGFDGRNWRPGDTAEDYIRNCQEGLEQFTDTRFCELAGMSRARLWRARHMASIPKKLFDRLIERHPPTPIREIVCVARFLKGEKPQPEIEQCPHCREILRIRGGMSEQTWRDVRDWARDTFPSYAGELDEAAGGDPGAPGPAIE